MTKSDVWPVQIVSSDLRGAWGASVDGGGQSAPGEHRQFLLPHNREAVSAPGIPDHPVGYQRYVQRVPMYRKGLAQRPLALSAVVVPTSRPTGHPVPGLGLALRVAEQRNSALVVLRSGSATREPYPSYLVPRSCRPMAVIDLPSPLPPALRVLMPELESDRHPVARTFRRTDLGVKRTLALVLGRMCGWQTALLLDDDIRSAPPIGAGGWHTEQHGEGSLRLDDVLADFAADTRLQVAGYDAVDFADHSVLGHALGLLGRAPGTFITGAALVVRCGGPLPFFAASYNEDWLFLLGLMLEEGSSMPSSAVKRVGSVFQERYDPYNVGRAQAEELGDLLAEGLFAMLGTPREDLLGVASSSAYWRERGRERRDLIHHLVSEIGALRYRHPRADLAYEALNGALAVYVQVEGWAERLAEYARSWQSDLVRWPELLDNLTPVNSREIRDLPSAIAALGLTGCTQWLGGQPANVTDLRGRGA